MGNDSSCNLLEAVTEEAPPLLLQPIVGGKGKKEEKGGEKRGITEVGELFYPQPVATSCVGVGLSKKISLVVFGSLLHSKCSYCTRCRKLSLHSSSC